MSRTRAYRNGVLEAENFPVAQVSDYLADPATVVWFDLYAPTAADRESIREELGLHELAVEDALEEYERPKLDR
jgi:magnesium transporter